MASSCAHGLLDQDAELPGNGGGNGRARLAEQARIPDAGDAMVRRSATGMAATYGMRVLKRSNDVRPTVSLSSGKMSVFRLDLPLFSEHFVVAVQVLVLGRSWQNKQGPML